MTEKETPEQLAQRIKHVQLGKTVRAPRRCAWEKCNEILRHDEDVAYCSPEHLDKHEGELDQRQLRAALEERDHGVCQVPNCQKDTLWLRGHLDALKARADKGDLTALNHWKIQVNAYLGDGFPRTALETPGATLWNAAHLVARVRGGRTHLDNARTWCLGCHSKDTSQLARDRSLARRDGPRPRRRFGR